MFIYILTIGIFVFQESKRRERRKPISVAYEYLEKHKDQSGLEAKWINRDIGNFIFFA